VLNQPAYHGAKILVNPELGQRLPFAGEPQSRFVDSLEVFRFEPLQRGPPDGRGVLRANGKQSQEKEDRNDAGYHARECSARNRRWKQKKTAAAKAAGFLRPESFTEFHSSISQTVR
jgi:hypothetical protein